MAAELRQRLAEVVHCASTAALIRRRPTFTWAHGAMNKLCQFQDLGHEVTFLIALLQG